MEWWNGRNGGMEMEWIRNGPEGFETILIFLAPNILNALSRRPVWSNTRFQSGGGG